MGSNKNSLIVNYTCLRCGLNFNDKCGYVSCPMCHHDYLKWNNYEELYKKGFKE